MKSVNELIFNNVKQDLNDNDKELSSGEWLECHTIHEVAEDNASNNLAMVDDMNNIDKQAYFDVYVLFFDSIARKAGLKERENTLNLKNTKKMEKALGSMNASDVTKVIIACIF